jgi:ABC-2 type transport system permease protein
MLATLASASSASGATSNQGRVARRTITRVVTKKAVRSGVGWGVVFGLYVATQALAYATGYKTAASREILVRQFGNNVGISALVGPARQIGTVPGYTAWKCLAVLAIIGAVWGILTSTKLTRGEEDAGRWELLLAGQTTRRDGALQALVGLGAGLLALFCATSVITVAVGRSAKVGINAGAAAYFSLAVVSGALMFLAVGALCGQLATSRRQGASYASAVLAVSYAIRMVADSSTDLGWLRWTTPLGWVEELQPLTSPRPVALVPIAAFTAVLAISTVYLAGRRDLGAGMLTDHSNVRRVRVLATRPFGLAVLLSRSTLLAWTASIVAYGLLLGSIAKSGGKIITSSPSLARVFARLGVSGAEAYLSVALLIMAVVLAFVAVGQVNAARKEESSGQLENLLVRPFSRNAWFGQQVALGTLVLVLGGLLAGFATWLGTALDHAHVDLASMLNAGFNVAVPALFLFGAGMLALALAPRLVSFVTYGLLVWFFLVEIVGGVVKVNHWVLDLSAFHQMAAAPATPVAWTANAVMIALALASAAVGAITFTRRDLKGE